MERLNIDNAFSKLKNSSSEFTEVFKHGSLQVEFYKPEKIDNQKPHTRDEIYVIASGKGLFQKGDEIQEFETSEVIFVSAGENHRFLNFSEDFSTWVFFYGPEGGEKP